MVRYTTLLDRDWIDKFQCVSIESIFWADWVWIVDLSRYIAKGCTTSLS